MKLASAALFGGATAAQIAAADPPLSWPHWSELHQWALTAPNPWLLLTALLTGLGALATVAQLVGPKAATASDVGEEGRKTRAEVALLSERVSGEGASSDSRHMELLSAIEAERVGITAGDIRAGRISDKVRAELIAALGVSIETRTEATPEQARAFAEATADLAQSSTAVDRSIAAQIIEGHPVDAADRLFGNEKDGAKRNAERARMAAQLYAPFSAAKAVAAFADAAAIDPSDTRNWAGLARLHHFRGATAESRRCAERADTLASEPRDVMIAQGLLGDAARAEGALGVAAGHYRRAYDVARDLVAKFPREAVLLHDLSNCLQKLGDVALDSGDLKEAQARFRASAKITKRLTKAAPNNSGWKRELSVSHNRMGDVLRDAGRRDEAEREFSAALAIRRKLAAANEENWLLQRDLSVSHIKMGEVLLPAGRIEEAKEHYAAALAIRKALSEADPENSELKRDLARSHSRLRGLAVDTSDLAEARIQSRAELAIIEQLAGTDPNNVQWQNDLARAHGNFAWIQKTDGDLDGAGRSVAAALTISESLAKADPANLDWQHNLWHAHQYVGEVAVMRGDLGNASRHFSAAFTLICNLVAKDPTQAGWHADLATTHDRLGEMDMAAGRFQNARRQFSESLTRREHLVRADPSNVTWRGDLFISHAKLAQLTEIDGDLTEAIRLYEGAKSIIVEAARAAPGFPQLGANLTKVERAISRLRTAQALKPQS